MARYTTEQKEAVIYRAREIGAAAAAKAEGVSYQTVLKWMKESGVAEKARYTAIRKAPAD